MPGLIPLLLALAIVESAARVQGGEPPTWLTALSWMVGGVVFWAALGSLFTATWRKLPGIWLDRIETAVQTGQLVWLAWLVHGIGIGTLAPSYCLVLSPWLLGLIAWWFTTAPAVARTTGIPWSRGGLVLHHLRFAMLPLLIALPVVDGSVAFAKWTSLESLLAESGWIDFSNFAGSLAFGLVVVTVMPVALVRMWGARPMESGALHDDLSAACLRAGVPVAGLLRWPVPGGRMHNAALVGVIPRLRWVLFTDDLLRDLDRQQVLAVLGHELGHARHGHLWIYLLFATASLMSMFAIHQTLEPLLSQSAWVQANRGLVELALLVTAVAILWRFTFGWISRACERQADLAGAELAGEPQSMQQALRAVARAAGQREDAPSWRHHSIAERISFLDHAERTPDLAARHHDYVQSIRTLLLTFTISLAAAMAVAYVLDPLSGARSDPVAALAAMKNDDPLLAKAMIDADSGRIDGLRQWYAGANGYQRRQLAGLVVLTFSSEEITADLRRGWRYRHRLEALQAVSTGDHDLDLQLDNLLAYLLVAGNAITEPKDLQAAMNILPRLESALKQRNDHGLWDTVGCIRFRSGDWQRAKEAFDRALAGTAGATSKESTRVRELYRHRRNTAESNRTLPPEVAPAPLPMEWDPQVAPAARPAPP